MSTDDRSPAISVRGLRKTYRVPERDAGAGAALRGLVRRQWREVPVSRLTGRLDAAAAGSGALAAGLAGSRWFWLGGVRRYAGASA